MVIGGWTPGEGNRDGPARRTPAAATTRATTCGSRVGSAPASTRRRLRQLGAALGARSNNPITLRRSGSLQGPPAGSKPQFVAEVEFSEWTLRRRPPPPRLQRPPQRQGPQEGGARAVVAHVQGAILRGNSAGQSPPERLLDEVGGAEAPGGEDGEVGGGVALPAASWRPGPRCAGRSGRAATRTGVGGCRAAAGSPGPTSHS